MSSHKLPFFTIYLSEKEIIFLLKFITVIYIYDLKYSLVRLHNVTHMFVMKTDHLVLGYQ